jgi:hypothetical protein
MFSRNDDIPDGTQNLLTCVVCGKVYCAECVDDDDICDDCDSSLCFWCKQDARCELDDYCGKILCNRCTLYHRCET